MRERPLHVPGLSDKSVNTVKYYLAQYDYFVGVLNGSITYGTAKRERNYAKKVIPQIDALFTKIGYRFGFDVSDMLKRSINPEIQITKIGAKKKDVYVRFRSARNFLYKETYEIMFNSLLL